MVRAFRLLTCSQVTRGLIQAFLLKRARAVSNNAANKDLRYLRALFNFGIRQEFFQRNPTQGLEFMPVEKRLKYVPPKEDVARVLLAADFDTQDYLLTIMDTMARVGEINRLTWEDVNLERRYVVLYTRKKKGGHLTPRKVYLTTRLYNVLLKRHRNRVQGKPWVFWGRHWSRKAGGFVEGPYQSRGNLMNILCRRAGVRLFGFHALRHFGASVLERANVPIGTIQRILGHESRTTTEIYLHSIGEAEQEAMAVFEKASPVRLGEESLTQILTQPGPRGEAPRLTP
jgi:integrase